MTQTNNSKASIIVSLILLLIVLATAIFFIISSSKPATKTADTKSSTSTEQLANNDKCSFKGTKSVAKPFDVEAAKRITIEETLEGTGAAVVSGDVICIDYKGTLLDGTEFDQSYKRGQPFTTQIGVGQVIPGWDLGIVGLKEGGKRKLTIPSDLAYGPRATGTIPADSTLVFEVELVKIIK